MSFFKSEIMRSFYRTANEKGWVETDTVVKTASANETLEPSGNVFADMCSLADALRTRGYIKEAKKLEADIMMYKTAETHLYKVFEEDGPDLIEHAHPEGDFKVEDAQDEQGKVQTDLSAHKSILDVVNKRPTGKLAALAEGIKKSAELNSYPIVDFITSLKFDEFDLNDMMTMFGENSGNLYNYLNIYDNKFFKEMWNYFTDRALIYNKSWIMDPRYITKNLQHDGVNLLNNLAKRGYRVSQHYHGLSEGAVYPIAQDLENQFNSKHPNMESKVSQANGRIKQKIRKVTDGLKSTSRSPETLSNYLSKIHSDGTLRFLTFFMSAFYEPGYKDALLSQFDESKRVVDEMIAKKKEVEEAKSKPVAGGIDAASVADSFRQAGDLLMSEMKNPQAQGTAKENANVVYYLASQARKGLEPLRTAVKTYTKQDINSFEEANEIAQQWIRWSKEQAKV